MWESRSRTTSWPGRVWASTEIRLPCVPDATNSPDSLPIRSAARASSRLTVGSSSHTSSPTSARAMASRMAGVGSVSVSERRSTMSCMDPISALRAQALDRAPAELGVGVLLLEPPQQLRGHCLLALAEVDLGQQPERLGDDERAGVVLEHQLQPLSGAGGVALIVVVAGDPDFFLREPAAADVDLGERVGRVPALGIFLRELPERREGLGGDGLVLLDGLQLVVERHRQLVLREIGDLVARVEAQERLELRDGLVELPLEMVGAADEVAGPRRVRGVGVALDDLLELGPRVLVAPAGQIRLSEAVQLVGRENRSGRGHLTCPTGP